MVIFCVFLSLLGFIVVGPNLVSLAEGDVIAHVEGVYSVCFGGWEYFLWIDFAGVVIKGFGG